MNVPSRSRTRCLPNPLRLGVAFLVAYLQTSLSSSAFAALESGVYQTIPGATVEEIGGRLPGGSRILPFTATLSFELAAAEPSLTAYLPNAVLEGGNPFALTVRSASGFQLPDGSYQFSGDYLGEVEPSGTQYLFDWKFSTAQDGSLLWNGITGWSGGHIWQITIDGIEIQPTGVPEPGMIALWGVGLGLLVTIRICRRE